MIVRLGRPAEGVRSDGGSAVAEFAMVSALVIVLFLAAFQLGFALHVRNTLIAHASEGARYGARADSSPAQGAERTRYLIRSSVSGRYATGVSAARTTEGGAAVVRVSVVAPLPVIGPFGPGGELKVSARAYAEDQ
ncbi:pilus assembly protein [Luteipulveratus sp. YIM 133132]|uniref:TadE/TadG family type IV pilus assembly protein n=1 Tax=Luteipulveratus flavus TaxID=3031728 RepID=UPI0023B18A36|nr:TadE family protein [Luteipulveratus sp. YIM 133132]MDE9367755.1 pilus assembly protein [Luteipulveratus sp. YIM 133132]